MQRTRNGLGLAALVFGVYLLTLALPVRAQDLGTPFVRNFTPKEYGADSQNWAVVQDNRGVVYAGNNQGVLSYDGVHWRLIRTPGRNTVRSLALDAEGRVFVGSVGEIGYLAPDPSGRMAFVSIADKLPPAARAFSDVWATRATSRGILFQSREELLLYKDGVFQVWKSSTTFHVAFSVGDRIFVRQREVGLEEMVDGKLQLVPGGDRFAHESVFAMVPMQDGILLATRNMGLFILSTKGVEPFKTEADTLLKKDALYGGAALPDGTVALATIQGGVIILDAQGRVRMTLDQSSGLQGDNVKAIYPDGHGSLWLAMDNGLARVEWPSPFTVLDERNGLKGTVWAVMRHEGRLYVATGQGAYGLKQPDAPGSRPRFEQVANSQTQSLSFLEFDGRLLLANSRGVFEIKDDAARPVRPSGNVAITLLRSRRDPSRVFVGLQGGLASMRLSGGQWLDEGLIPGVSDDIYSLAEDSNGRLWLGTGGQGALRVTFGPSWSGGAASPPPRVDRFGTAQGLPPNQILVKEFEGEPLFATHAGLLRFEGNSGLFSPDPRFSSLFPEGSRWVKVLTPCDHGELWMDTLNETTGQHESGLARPGKDGSYAWDPTRLRRVSDTAVESIYPGPSGLVWFGGPDGLIRYDLSVPRPMDRPFPVLIRGIHVKDGPFLPSSSMGTKLPFRQNALRFDFAAPGQDQSSGLHYQAMLEGYDHAWGAWSLDTSKEYTNLREGDYRFRVKARNAFGKVTGEAIFPFQVLPPWYRTWWAWLLWVACAGGVLAAGIGARTRFLHQRAERLETKVAEATEELREREQLLAHQAADLENANRALHALNDQKDQYLGLVAHDLRNPLHGILLTAENLGEESADPAVRQSAAKIMRTAEDMGGLIGRFLDIAAIDAGTVKANLESIPLEALVHEAIIAMVPLAKAKAITMQPEISPGIPMVEADHTFAKEILANLLSNAIKFSPTGSRVILRLESANEEVTLSVEDQGPGLTEEDKRRLFGRFARLSAQPTAGEGSVGLGLSIVKHMVEACGGRIWVDSAEGQGAAFRVAFRRAD
ncbi:MAG: hypothetical protein JST24_02765 [Acidobacteria bacterium]|nr:hypothetical protein [Acidobacteriota bacterium]